MSAVCDRSAVAVLRPLAPSLDIMLPALVTFKKTSQLETSGCSTYCRKHLTVTTHLRHQTCLLLVSVRYLIRRVDISPTLILTLRLPD